MDHYGKGDWRPAPTPMGSYWQDVPTEPEEKQTTTRKGSYRQLPGKHQGSYGVPEGTIKCENLIENQ